MEALEELEKKVRALQEQNVSLTNQLKEMTALTQPLQEQNAALQAQLKAQKEVQVSSSPNPVKTDKSPNPFESDLSTTEIGEVSAVSPKLPPFWTERPRHWFTRVEAQFKIAGIKSEQTKFDYVIAQLDARLIGEIDDIICDPPATDMYQKLKSELILRLSMSEAQRVRQLVSDEELDGRKPSQFLRHLRSLAGAELKDDSIIRELWMRRLPNFLQAILKAHVELSLDKLAHLADSILDVPQPSQPGVFAAASTPSADINARLDELSKQVAALQFDRSRSRSRFRRNRSQSNSRRSDTPPAKLCWYHKKFGVDATKCTKPCSWTRPDPENSNDSR